MDVISHCCKWSICILLPILLTNLSEAKSKKYLFDFDFDGQEDYLSINFNDSLNNYDKIEFYLSTQGAFEFHSNQGYEYMPNYSGILADNDGWESSYWELFYWIKKDNSTNLFIFSEKNDMNALNVHQVFRITNKSFHVPFRKPFEIVKVLPKGEVVNLFGLENKVDFLSDTVINGRSYRVRKYVPYVCYSLDTIESFEHEKSISYNLKFAVGWAKSDRRRVINDKITKRDSFLFETYRQFPETSLRFLTKSDLSIYSNDELRIMRNEIFADYGYPFDDDILKWQYEKLGWYKEEDKDVQSDLSLIEIRNIALIKEIENEAK
jgi:hypothetical protein